MFNPNQFVYVNQDGSVREVTSDESEYLSEEFHPADGGRPYIKSSFKSQDGWGSISGFLSREKTPPNIKIEPANPNYSPPVFDAITESIEDGKIVGDIVTENPDGSVTCKPNPEISHEERFELLKELQLERQRDRESFAKRKQGTDPN